MIAFHDAHRALHAHVPRQLSLLDRGAADFALSPASITLPCDVLRKISQFRL
jgi:hypothetical protein